MRWARWRDFATGMLGMGGSHLCHMTFNALGLRALWEDNGGAPATRLRSPPATIRVSAECSEAEPLVGPTLLLLGNICTPFGRAIEYDLVAGTIVGDDEANRALRPPRREGWAV